MTTPLFEPAAAKELAKVLLALRASTQRDAVVLRRNERNRINLLIVHAIAALAVAPLFALSGRALTGPNWEGLHYIPGFPYSLAALFWAGGLVLLPATLTRHRRWEIAGLWLISLWYTIMSFGFFVPVFSYVQHVLAGHRPPEPPTFYAWVVYAHLAVIMRVHMITLWRMSRAESAGKNIAHRIPGDA